LGPPWVVKIRGWNLEGHGALGRSENPGEFVATWRG
jgi:hypothetical protein